MVKLKAERDCPGDYRMSIFKQLKFNIDDIISVVILEQTQNYRTRTKSGLVFGNSLLNPDVVFMDGNSEPTGVTYTFSVTHKDGKKEIIKADSGTDRCDLLLQKAMDGDITNIPPVSEDQDIPKENNKKPAPERKKNQLPRGVYEIGKDIPAGTYDFHHVWGNGSLQKYIAKETILGNNNLMEWIGDKESYEHRDCINVKCVDGEYLHVDGNLVVEINI